MSTPVNWKTLFDGLAINGYTPVMFDLKGYIREVLEYEMHRLLGDALKVVVIGEWPLQRQSLPLITVVRLGEHNNARFIGESYAASSMDQRKAAEDAAIAGTGPAVESGMTTADPGQDVEAMIFAEALEVTVWSDNKEVADALGKLVKAVIICYSAEMIAAADLQEFTIAGGTDLRGFDTQAARPMYWRPYNVTAQVPFKLVRTMGTVKAARVRQKVKK